ncbi:hypothetical protein BCU74_03835 [Vibrio breoganii]|uniref:hypothetical protein n=1 Tax=Vibrio breoganii TaxID=553239 RepID=UPI000C84754F|nr:hypothetical protein [Vibrio breoganii]PMH12415.1 hypothetical protein BCU74_03835 [Vibrio breoganii]
MAKPYWQEADRQAGSSKIEFLKNYMHKHGSTKGLREAQVMRLVDLANELVVDDAIEYFETLPNNVKSAFKTAYRQHVYKAQKRGETTKTVELTEQGYDALDLLVENYVKMGGFDVEGQTKTELRSAVIGWAFVQLKGVTP